MESSEVKVDIDFTQIPEVVNAAIADQIDKINSLVSQSKKAEITDQEGYSKGTSLLNLIKALKKSLDETRKNLGAPLRDATTKINAEFKPFIKSLDEAGSAVSDKMLQWSKDERKRREEAAKKEQEEREQKALEMAEKVEDEDTQDMIMESVTETQVKAEKIDGSALIGSSHIRKSWTGRVYDEKRVLKAIIDGDVPMAVISFNKAVLNRYAKDHGKEEVVNGIKCEAKEQIATRS